MFSTGRVFKRALTTSATDATFPSRIPTVGVSASDAVESNRTKPNSTAVEKTGDSLLLVPFGTASDNHTFDMRVIGWSRIGGVAGTTNPLWVPSVIAQLACTHCAAVGVAGAAVAATERFTDTISVTNGLAVGNSAPTDTIAQIIVDLTGYEYWEMTVDLGSGTDANALYASTGGEGL